MTPELFLIIALTCFAAAMSIREAYRLGRHRERQKHTGAILRPDSTAKQRL